MVTIYAENKNQVHIIADLAVKRYSENYHNPKIKFYESSRYVITPGEVRQYKESYYYGLSEQKNFGEPFHASSTVAVIG